MKYLLVLCLFIFSCKSEYRNIDNTNIAMPKYWREITGYDSIQLTYGGRGVYNEAKKDYDVTWDSLQANFCYPNKWKFEKVKDTVFIHDTVYKKFKAKKLNKGLITCCGANPKYDSTEQQIYEWGKGCDSDTKAFNVKYWKTQCGIVKHHNEVLPEESYSMPQLSSDSCMVTFPL